MNRPWPFQSPLALPPDEADWWWKHCFLPFPWPELRTSWVAVVGPRGSGKSIALAHRQRNEHLLARLDLQGGTEESARQTVHTLVSRLRKALEPVPSRPVYLHGHHKMKYWIANFIEVAVNECTLKPDFGHSENTMSP